MKVDRSRLKKSTSEVPIECQNLIDRLRPCGRAELLEELTQVETWTFGKCELYHWIDILDIFDTILEWAAESVPSNRWALACDVSFNADDKKLLLWTLHFTTLLIEHSFSRHLYNSMEHLNTLLASSDMQVVLGVLNLLYMFSKRSNFITRLNNDKRQILLSRLQYLAESWGGKENGFGLADCCNSDKPIPPSATTLHFEFYCDNTEAAAKNGKSPINYIHLENIDKMLQSPAEIMRGLVGVYNIPPHKEMLLFTHVRLAHRFSDYKSRLYCVQARLQALSVLVYSNALQENAHMLLYPGLLDELVELLEMQLPYLVEIRSAALRTLTSIIHLDRNPHFPKKPGSRLSMIIDVTGANLYHGFLPTLVRNCIQTLTNATENGINNPPSTSAAVPPELADPMVDDDEDEDEDDEEEEGDCDDDDEEEDEDTNLFPLPLATALFSFLYHLASYEAGGEALVNCGMMESLLHVINWHGNELEHITFVTRAVRVIDLITNIDMQSFQSHGGLNSFIGRLQVEVNICRREQSFEIRVRVQPSHLDADVNADGEPSDNEEEMPTALDYSACRNGKTCLPQRAALLKSMLNFLKKALQDPAFSDSIRHVMEGSLPSSLKHIISNAEYYGPSLFLLATDVVTVYVFQEPSLLSALQDNGLTEVVLHALLIKEVPATREVLGSLPNVFSALCLNARGLAAFVACQPFDRLFKVLLSPTYLPAMRRRRSSDPQGDTASNLGNAMDELMRHQPSLKVAATTAIIKLLNELCTLGTDTRYICQRAHSTKNEIVVAPVPRVGGNNEAGSSDEDDEDEEEASTSSHTNRDENSQEPTNPPVSSEKTPIVLVDYIINVMKFVDAILSNNSTDDHCREFVTQGGLAPLLKILSLPNLPVDCPASAATQSVASVCKSILNLAHEPLVLREGLCQLSQVLNVLKPLCSNINKPGGSILLHELASAPKIETAFSNAMATPLLHAMNAAHGYVMMFVHVCRTGQSDIRSLSLQHWGSDEGMSVLQVLAELYTSLVWESTLLLALCSDDIIPANCDFGKEDMDRLIVHDKVEGEITPMEVQGAGASGMTSAMQALSTDPAPMAMDVDQDVPSTSTGITAKPKDERSTPTSQQLKYIRPLLGASSRLGRALAELFGLLVKLCVGSPVRARRGQNVVAGPAFAGPFARSVATALNCLLASGLNWEKLPPSPIPKFRLTFLICSVGFTSPMLFDEKKFPYHLMLQKFVSLGGQDTFFKTFRWALSAGGKIPIEQGLEHAELPDGTGEFLDAWLMLLEKMVNPKTILDTPHTISNKAGVRALKNCPMFDPIKYLTQIHKQAFEALLLLWGKKPLANYGCRMTESILSILRHILRGEKIIKERATKVEKEPEPQPVEPREQEDVNYEHLYQLVEMGFPFEQCREALLITSNLEQATDYLLARDQMMYAITMSMNPVEGNGNPKLTTGKKNKEEDLTPLSDKAIDLFIKDAIPTCLRVLDVLPETVYRVCDLFVTITKRNGEIYRDNTLDILLSEIRTCIALLLAKCETKNVEEIIEFMLHSEQAAKMAVRMHLFSLLFEGPVFQEMRLPCAQAVQRSKIIPSVVRLLSESEYYLRRGSGTDTNSVVTPKWLTPLILLLDLVEKVSLCTQRREVMHKVTKPCWMWYDVSTGKWNPYTSSNQKIINEAYWNGENNVRITCGRRRYTLAFHSMNQINDDSANYRPITMALIAKESKAIKKDGKDDRDDKNDSAIDGKDGKDDDKPDDKDDKPSGGGTIAKITDMETEDLVAASTSTALPFSGSPVSDKRSLRVTGLTDDCAAMIVRTCVSMMRLSIDRDTLQAVMRICLRLTRDFRCAKVFAQEGGVTLLLEMTQASHFNGFVTIATLLIRHLLEEPQSLSLAIEKVIRGKASAAMPPSHKELVYFLRQVSSAVCRNPDVFHDVAKGILRVDMSPVPRRPEEEEKRLILSCEPPTKNPAQPMEEEESIQVIFELLNYIVKPPLVYTETTTLPVNSEKPAPQQKCGHRREAVPEPVPALVPALVPVSVTEELNIVGPNKAVPKEPAAAQPKVPDEEAKKPMFTRHMIIKLLAEAVKSYGAIAKIITDYTYKAGCSELITEDCTALAFMLDKLLPLNDINLDPECSMMVRMLVAALASCNHSPDSQAVLVSEVKSALMRALMMSESAEKHTHIQLLTGLISTMIENCPQPQNTRVGPTSPQGTGHSIVKVMLRKGLLSDLARVPHFLDLSSPNMAITVNAAMKPLEALSRIVNSPMVPQKFPRPKPLTSVRVIANGTTSTEATNAQGEDAVEDAENTEHDISAAAESLEPHSEGQAQEEGDVPGLEDIMDQLLERDSQSGNNRSYSDVASGRNHHPMEIDDETAEIRNLVYDTERDVTEELMSTDSGDSDSNPSDPAEENEDEGDDEDIDEGEENEDNNYEENEDNNTGLGFFDNENPSIFRIAPERDEEVLMIQYADPDPESDSVSRMVHWNASNGFQLPFAMFEDNASNNEIAAPSSHPLLMSRHNVEVSTMSVSRTQRANHRQRRYQYLQLNPRNHNPPVILQRLLGPGSQNLTMSGPVIAEPSLRVSNRVVVMENGFGILPPAEDNLEFDQSGYLFGPNLAAISHVPSALYWWNEESKLLDGDSEADACIIQAHKLMPFLEMHREAELAERKRKRQEEEGFDYKNSVLKNSNETMETEAEHKPAEAQTSARSDSSGNDSASDTAQLLAESIIDSVLRPTTSSSADNRGVNGQTRRRTPGDMSLPRPSEIFTEQDFMDARDILSGNLPNPMLGGSAQSEEAVAESNNTSEPEAEPEPPLSPRSFRLQQYNVFMQNLEIRRVDPNEPVPEGQDGTEVLFNPSFLRRMRRAGADRLAGRPPFMEDNIVPIDIDRFLPRVDTNDDIETMADRIARAAILVQQERMDEQFRLERERTNQSSSSEDHTSSSNSQTQSNASSESTRDRITLTREAMAALEMSICSSDQQESISQASSVSSNMDMLGPARERPNEDNEIIEILQRFQAPSQRRTSNSTLDDDMSSPARDRIQRARRNMERVRSADELSTESEGYSDPTEGNISVLAPYIWNPGFQANPLMANPQMSDPPVLPGMNEMFSAMSRSQQNAETSTQPMQVNVATQGCSTSTGVAIGDTGMEIPEGVDPSFLEALPEDVRREVIAEQRRLIRLQQRSQGATCSDGSAGLLASEVSPEFLAALPPNLQEEVLAQQRLEQQRQAAAQANPDDPVDAAAFFQNLQPSLRQAILTDIEESQISVLPPDLAAEAQNLRRDWEARNRQIMQERFLTQLQSNTALSSILRHSSRGGRIGGARYAIHTVPPQCNWNTWTRGEISPLGANSNHLKIKGRQLLDHESLSCLLVLLFADEPRLNTQRLHRVIRNLCYHAPTRDWIVKTLLSIIEKSVTVPPPLPKAEEEEGDEKDKEDAAPSRASKRTLRPAPLSVKLTTDPRSLPNNAAWLNIKMDAALGCRANVFIVHRTACGRRSDRLCNSSVTVHPQAGPTVCRHALEVFIALAKSFPTFFLPLKYKPEELIDPKTGRPVTTMAMKTKVPDMHTDFWDMLLKLDCCTKKGKSVARLHGASTLSVDSEIVNCTLEHSTFGQLLSILASPVILRSTSLTDKLLRLLNLITLGLPGFPTILPFTKRNKKGQKHESVSAFEDSLRIAINVIVSKSCSEEGLEDATSMLFNVSEACDEMRFMVLWLLVHGLHTLATEVTLHIRTLLAELQANKAADKQAALEDLPTSTERVVKGLLCDRFTKEAVVITAAMKIKPTCDLQLPSMSPLTSKTSSQFYFLRLLKLIQQVHDAIVKSRALQENEKSKYCKNMPDLGATARSLVQAEIAESSSAAHSQEEEPDLEPIEPDYDIEVDVRNMSDMMNFGLLWNTLSLCLMELEHTPDHHAVLVLQPTVEAFFLMHSPSKILNQLIGNEDREEDPLCHLNQPSAVEPVKPPVHLTADQQKFLVFAEKHRTVLNQILRQSTCHLPEGPFAVLVDHTRILDFDVKRKYFRAELDRLDAGLRREETAVHVRRSHIFEDSFRELYRRPAEDWKNRFYIVFEDEEGQDAGGLLREWYMIISRDIFNPMYALFTVSPGDRVTYMINSSSHCNPNHLCYYKFVGRVIAKAIYDNKLLECYFTRSFYKHILGIQVKHTDMESEDYSLFKGLKYLTENKVEDVGYDITFSAEVNEFGSTQIRELIPNGQNILVTEENKMEYIRLLCQMKMTGAIKQQLRAFLEGFYDIIPKRLIAIFNEQELELLISGLPNVDIEDLKANTEYHKYQANSLQIQWFWRALRNFDQAERAKFLQFVTGTSKVPLQGFGALEGMNGVQKFQIHRDDRSTDRLPSAHTCFNQLDLPVYETYDKLRSYLLKAIHECSEGFGFA